MTFNYNSLSCSNVLDGETLYELCTFESTALNTIVTDVSESLKATDTVYALVSAAFVVFMQSGFALLEQGSIRKKNHTNILLKNITDITIGAIIFYFLGFGFAYGNHYDKEGNPITRDDGEEWNPKTQFIGDSLFAATGFEEQENFYQEFCFQFAFASAAATIVSGAVAERANFHFYLIYSLFMTGFIYPCIVNWTWGGGWLAAGDGSVGFYDFAGSGIVHMTGGVSGLVAAIILGPRINKFQNNRRVASYDNSGVQKDKKIEDIPINNIEDVNQVRLVLQARNEASASGFDTGSVTLGTLILWLGWLFFNAGSTLNIVGYRVTAGRAMTNTLICPSSAALTTFFLKPFITGDHSIKMDISSICNGILAGLVTITAGCDNLYPWMTFLVGILGGIVYCISVKVISMCQIDDPLDAFSIHGSCGAWGLIVVAFCHRDVGIFYGNDPAILGWQLAGIVTITVWAGGITAILWLIGAKCGVIRCQPFEEILGMDYVKHQAGLSNSEKEYVKNKIDSLREGVKGAERVKSGTNEEVDKLAIN